MSELTERARHIVENGGLRDKDTALKLIEQLEAAQQRIAELESDSWVRGLEESIIAAHDRAEEAEAELARRDAAAGEPVAVVDIQRGRRDGRKFALCYTSAGHSLPDDVYNLYTATQPSALPPERETQRADWTVKQWVEHVGGRYKDGNPANYVEFGSIQAIATMIKQLVHCIGAVGYNQAIADAKALGCKAIKLPEGYAVCHDYVVSLDDLRSHLREQGFTVED